MYAVLVKLFSVVRIASLTAEDTAECPHWQAHKLRPVASLEDGVWEVASCLKGNYGRAWGESDSGFFEGMVWMIFEGGPTA